MNASRPCAVIVQNVSIFISDLPKCIERSFFIFRDTKSVHRPNGIHHTIPYNTVIGSYHVSVYNHNSHEEGLYLIRDGWLMGKESFTVNKLKALSECHFSMASTASPSPRISFVQINKWLAPPNSDSPPLHIVPFTCEYMRLFNGTYKKLRYLWPSIDISPLPAQSEGRGPRVTLTQSLLN